MQFFAANAHARIHIVNSYVVVDNVNAFPSAREYVDFFQTVKSPNSKLSFAPESTILPLLSGSKKW